MGLCVALYDSGLEQTAKRRMVLVLMAGPGIDRNPSPLCSPESLTEIGDLGATPYEVTPRREYTHARTPLPASKGPLG